MGAVAAATCLRPSGWLRELPGFGACTWAPSPNHNERPQATAIWLAVIHGISLPPGVFGGTAIDDLFLNRTGLSADEQPELLALVGLRVSSHFLITRRARLVQYVAVDRRAWHAGQSVFEGEKDCNDFSVGIELEGTDDQPYEPRQIELLAALLSELSQHIPSLSTVTGHSTIAPGRKTDPGDFFDWPLLARELERLLPTLRCRP
jgi:AmpD protein